ncbi:hypothetical protein QP116_07420 [Pseudoglutamicibacter cumminsii]|uniref:DUF306 domain-containing protein n=1 Tax=Pseudoglutamicibacter cumminsii TaxID=156979 RepID=A0AAP4C7W9_9MICC|nr:hypothetical protein [Pseudoglutamicibacter cumminsii]MDK6275555.1 hypothetical protein [Pseudoglutamicibacter cumminsii]
MSRLSTRIVRAAALLAPASLVVASLAGCAPKHPTTLDSPTPESSQFHMQDGSVEGENTKAESTTEASSQDGTSTKASSVSVLGFSESTQLGVKSLTVNGNTWKTKLGSFVLTPEGDGAGMLVGMGQCSSGAYKVATNGSDVTLTESHSTMSDCEPADQEPSDNMSEFLTSGALRVSETADGVELTNGQDSIVLQKLN